MKLYELIKRYSIVHGGVIGLLCYLSKLLRKNKARDLFIKLKETTSDGFDYRSWIKKYECCEKLKEIAGFREEVSIAVIILVNDKRKKNIEDSVRSVAEQVYTKWNLYVAGQDCLSTGQKKRLQEDVNKYGYKVSFVLGSRFGPAVNETIDSLEEDWVVFVEAGDLLHRSALFFLAREYASNRDVLFVYSDHDFLDSNGRRISPRFKPDWNPDLLMSKNYIFNMSAYSLGLLRGLVCYRDGYEGAQDYDLLIRCLLELEANSICHIPRVLYHRRGKSDLDDNEDGVANGLKSLADNLKLCNENAYVKHGKLKGCYKVDWLLPSDPCVTLIMPVKNTYNLTRQAIESIFKKTDYSNYEIIVVNNNSDDSRVLEYFQYLKKEVGVKVIEYPYPFNFSAINNLAVQHSKGQVVGLVNNDIEVINESWMREMVSQAMRVEVGCVGAMLYYPDNRVQHAGVIVGLGGVAGHAHKYFKRGSVGYTQRLAVVQNYSAVTAACLFVRKSVYLEVGGMNENELAVAFNDVDFCLKVLTAGYRNVWTPFAELYHHESITRGYEDSEAKRERFELEVGYMRKRWGNMIANDHAYNPNLTLKSENFALSFPPRIEIEHIK